MESIVTVDRDLYRAHREAVIGFLKAHGMNPNVVPLPTDIEFSDGKVTFEMIELTEDGKVLWDGAEPAIATVEMDQVVPWPLATQAISA